MGWAQRVMVFLNVATQLVLINVLWLLGTLAGGVVLGVLPASVSAARLVTALFLGSPSDALWRDFWLWWQHSWASAHRRGWPLVWLLCLVLRTCGRSGWRSSTIFRPPHFSSSRFLWSQRFLRWRSVSFWLRSYGIGTRLPRRGVLFCSLH